MTVMKDLALKASIDDFCRDRDTSIRLLEQGLRTMKLAQEATTQRCRYGFPPDLIPRMSLERAREEIDRRWWRHCFHQTGLARLMDVQATREFEATLEKDCPAFTVDNIQSIALSMYQSKEEIMLRGIYNVFRKLDWSFKTNEGQAFEVERKLIVPYLFDTWYTKSGSFVVRYEQWALLNDVHRCICVLMEEPYQEYGLQEEVQAQLKEGNTYEGRYLKIRGFKNGNAHIWILCETLRARINRCIAEYCGPSIPDGRRQRRA